MLCVYVLCVYVLCVCRVCVCRPRTGHVGILNVVAKVRPIHVGQLAVRLGRVAEAPDARRQPVHHHGVVAGELRREDN